jgi:pyruvate formate lyase activating enzyme
VKAVAVTAGYVTAAPRAEFYAHMDAANVDLKGFTERFYAGLAAGHLEPVKETLRYLARETRVWLEITNLLIPGWNDSDAEIDAMTRWIVDALGPAVPVHFTAFHPDYRMLDVAPTPAATLRRAREIAMASGVRYAYTGNVRDPRGQSTWCHRCGALLIERDGYQLGQWGLTTDSRCAGCGEPLPGVFAGRPGRWGSRRLPVVLSAPA